jgi:pyrroline-5-carboxylate reductase
VPRPPRRGTTSLRRMIVGFVGAGSMAAAMARGWSGQVDRILFTDSGSGRAEELASEVGGEAVGSNAELAESADLIVLAVKPAGLDGVAAEIGGVAKPVISILGATPLASVVAAFPEADVCRVMPNVAVEVRRGVLCVAGGESSEVHGLLERLGHVVELPDSDFDAATAVMGCAPAYLALAVEALADAGTEAGLSESLARDLVVETTAGTAELLRMRHPSDVRRAVASPGGSTEAGLEALDREGAREAFEEAVRASLARMKG